MAFREFLTGLILALCLTASAHAVVPELRQPAWAELSQEEKQILAPLSRDWDKMEGPRKKKWLGIAKRYRGMAPGEQARVQSQMKDWASLAPDERKQVREQYKSLQKAPPKTKKTIRQKWEEYQNLPEEEKKRLAEKAASRPSPKPGIARPTPSQKVPPVLPQPLPAAAAPAEAAAAAPPASAGTPVESPAPTESSAPAGSPAPEAAPQATPAPAAPAPAQAQQQ